MQRAEGLQGRVAVLEAELLRARSDSADAATAGAAGVQRRLQEAELAWLRERQQLNDELGRSKVLVYPVPTNYPWCSVNTTQDSDQMEIVYSARICELANVLCRKLCTWRSSRWSAWKKIAAAVRLKQPPRWMQLWSGLASRCAHQASPTFTAEKRLATQQPMIFGNNTSPSAALGKNGNLEPLFQVLQGIQGPL